MNKTQITMAAAGGVSVALAIALAAAAWSVASGTAERREELADSQSNAKKINAGEIAPIKASVDAIAKNARDVAVWGEESLATVSMGDMAPDATATPESFKQRMVAESRELAKLPGTVDGKIVAGNFGFGFPDYITGVAMPPRDGLAALQRQWTEIKSFVELLADCGICELQAVTAVEPPKKPVVEEPKKGRNRRAAKKEAEAKPLAEEQAYELRFTAKPAAMVRVFNAIATMERFAATTGFSFAREKDTLAEVVAGVAKETREGGRRKRRRASADAARTAEDEADKPQNKKGLVTDPAMDIPLTVSLKISTFDFGTRKEAADGSVE